MTQIVQKTPHTSGKVVNLTSYVVSFNIRIFRQKKILVQSKQLLAWIFLISSIFMSLHLDKKLTGNIFL